MNILSYFNRDDATYAANGIVMFRFKDERRDDFLREGVDFYRRAFVSDEDLEEDIKEMGGARRDRIAEYLPSEGNIQSGDFGEILTYLLFSALFPDYNSEETNWQTLGESLLRDLILGLLRGKHSELNRFLGRSGIPMLSIERVNEFLSK